MKKTAVEWLSEQLLNLDIEFDSMLINRANYWVKRNNILEQAKEIEKEQQGYSEEDMKEAFNVGFNVGYNDETSPSYLTAEKFIEQFKKKQ